MFHFDVVASQMLMIMSLAEQHTEKLVLTILCAHLGVDPPASTAGGHMERMCLAGTMRAAAACSRLLSPRLSRCGSLHDLKMVHVNHDVPDVHLPT